MRHSTGSREVWPSALCFLDHAQQAFCDVVRASQVKQTLSSRLVFRAVHWLAPAMCFSTASGLDRAGFASLVSCRGREGRGRCVTRLWPRCYSITLRPLTIACPHKSPGQFGIKADMRCLTYGKGEDAFPVHAPLKMSRALVQTSLYTVSASPHASAAE